MDALSDVLELIRLKSAVYFRRDFANPWGMDVPDGPYAQFHLVVRGRCLVQRECDAQPCVLYAGDIVVFPFGEKHWIADSKNVKLLSGQEVVQSIMKNHNPFEGEDCSTTLVCGHFEFSRDIDHPLLRSLPPFFHITDSERHDLSWLESVTSMIFQEKDSGKPGAEIVANRLGEVLFIHVLRSFISQENSNGNNFFACLK